MKVLRACEHRYCRRNIKAAQWLLVLSWPPDEHFSGIPLLRLQTGRLQTPPPPSPIHQTPAGEITVTAKQISIADGL
ncbi:hypothetical protein LSTR_LSTR002843 [Laodelphax striatellus]|uniref:Uncharacterized protein n=1 Tax=Laodelphax striatellus TaxID=195883 RepID=A0A482XIQ7_LAOST|nr:hypothetical protein LSTR_LSTR002843 [Laodelphax striatellus]